MVRLLIAIFIFTSAGLLCVFGIGDLAHSPKSVEFMPNAHLIQLPSELGIVDEISHVKGSEGGQGVYSASEENGDFKLADSAKVDSVPETREKPIPLEIFKGHGDADAYFISFKEVCEPSRNVSQPSERPPIRRRRRVRRKHTPHINVSAILHRQLREVSVPVREKMPMDEFHLNMEKEIAITFNKADEIARAILKTNEATSKSLGVCRKSAPINFISSEEVSDSKQIIESIISQLRESLEMSLGCRSCIVPHQDMMVFLKWLLHDDVSLKCCISKPKTSALRDNYLLFNHDSKNYQKCSKPTCSPNESKASTPSFNAMPRAKNKN